MMTSEPARILKANAIRGLGSKIAFNYEDLRARCDQYVEKTRQDTCLMIEQAQIAAESIRRRAHEEGSQAGRQQGLRDADAEIQKRATQLAEQMVMEKLKTTLPALQRAAEALVRERHRWLAEWEAAAVRLSVAIAEKLVRHQIIVQPHVTTQMLSEALQLAAGNAQIKVKLHPQDQQQLGEHADEVVASMACCGDAILVADETVSPGGCIIETRHGVIEARLETQLERITSELLQCNS